MLECVLNRVQNLRMAGSAKKGSIEPGKLADFIILGYGPLTCDTDALNFSIDKEKSMRYSGLMS